MEHKPTDIQMVDLHNQYLKIKDEVDEAIGKTITSSRFIGGVQVSSFSENLCNYLGAKNIVTCGNGTDALQIALMALDLEQGDEVIVPAFTYVATAEVIALLGFIPKMVDVDPFTFNINLDQAELVISTKTKVVIPVHLYGQSSNMDAIMSFASNHNLFVIEDNAQAIGATYEHKGQLKKTGTIGHIGTFSFFPSKNLGCYGDGGAISTDNEELAQKIKMIANHGQSKKYYHDIIGVNSRLDSLQAAILNIKLKYLDGYIVSRNSAATFYDENLKDVDWIKTPTRAKKCNHVFHQYTIQVNVDRDKLKNYLNDRGVKSMVYYPLPLYKQKAYSTFVSSHLKLEQTEKLCKCVLSLPMHTELKKDTLEYIIESLKSFNN